MTYAFLEGDNMFTGLIQEQGKILRVQRKNQSIVLTCQASKELLTDYHIGDSMAVNGACLTAIEKNKRDFSVDIMPETFHRTTFSLLKEGDSVNLERALTFHGRIEGHFVSGHIDSTTRLIKKREKENALLLTFHYPEQHKGEIIAQGSIAINGVSLTVTEVTEHTFSVSLIPHSRNLTNLSSLYQGHKVNIETDLIAKYLKAQYQPSKKIERRLYD